MPPRINQGQSSFSVSQESQQVICPLKNQDGTNCRKRCLGEKRFRSMQEHIRRAHPDHYIPKLPATEESFQAMINTAPSARPAPASTPSQHYLNTSTSPDSGRYIGGHNSYSQDRQSAYSSPAPTRTLDDPYPAAANAATAAVALAQLHGVRQDSVWASDTENENEHRRPTTNSSYDLPPLRNHLLDGPFSSFGGNRPRELLPSMLDRSPPGRSSTLPPIPRSRPRKSSLTSARRPKHERTKSKEYARRMSMGKASSAEPSSQYNRWIELIDAATSANEADSDRDLTPVCEFSYSESLQLTFDRYPNRRVP
ncbi:MAG: hypothetical protein GOMPHAMPRED_008294 [Gomphillus americanus]|uniref:Uncharacterized protein n=1 Tax=Gomphillus americanus TaxID=1940652 RepID=A0A8H3F078_9LECA|nr:MAG: hypothetical protein GOMPHAMPRED_008294 [Gomphillus americanus]